MRNTLLGLALGIAVTMAASSGASRIRNGALWDIALLSLLYESVESHMC